MDVSHITTLLSNLGKNQVTLQINENDFQETKVEAYYMKNVTKDIFDGLDDIASMCKNKSKVKNKNPTTTSRVKVEVTKNKPTNPVKTTTALSHNLVYTLACIRNTMLTLETKQDRIIDITVQFSLALREYVAQCTARRLNIESCSKDMIIEQLHTALELDVNGMSLHHNHIDIIVKVASRYLQKNIVVLQSHNQNNEVEVLAREYLESNTNIAEYITIQTTIKDNQPNFTLGENASSTKVDNIYKENAIRKLKQQEGFQEKLKSQTVKDLRFIAKDIGIDIVDAHTGKLYSKSDIKQLIEAQLRAHL